MTATWSAARGSRLAVWRLLVAAAWFTAALCALLALPDVVRFRYHPSDSGIFAWASANRYPKQQDIAWFLAAVAGVPAVMLAGWGLWMAGSAAASRLGRQRIEGMLKLYALWHLPWLLAWPRLLRLRADAWNLLLTAVGCSLIMAVISVPAMRFLIPRFRRLRASQTADSVAPAADEPLPSPASISLPPQKAPRSLWIDRLFRALRWGWRLAAGLLLYLVVPAGFYVLYLNPGCDGAVDLFHEGEFLIPLDELLHGSIPYRDIYLQHGLIHNALIPWLGAKLFEPTLFGIRMARAYLAPLGYLGFYYLVLTACRTRLLPAAFMAVAGCSVLCYASERTLFGILSVTVLAAAFVRAGGLRILSSSPSPPERRPGPRTLVSLCLRDGWPLTIAGALAMLAFWHSVEVGLYALAAGIVFLALAGTFRGGIPLWRRPLPLACYLVGAAALFLPPGLYLGLHGAFDDMLRNVWIQCAYQNETWGLPFPNFFGVFTPILASAAAPRWQEWLVAGGVQFYYAPVTLTLAAAFLAFRAMGAGFWQSRTAPVLLLLTLAGVNFFRTTLGRADWWHIMSGFMFALVLVLFLTDRLLATAWDRLTARRVAITHRLLAAPWLAAGLAAGAGVFCFVSLFNPLPAFKSRWERLNKWPPATAGTVESIPRAGLSVLPVHQVEQIRLVTAYIREHTQPGERVFDFSSQAGYLFFADRRSLSRYFQVCYASLPSMQQEVVDDMERLRPSLVLFASGTYYDGIDRVSAASRHRIIARYLLRHYERADKVGQVVFWRRRDTPLPAEAQTGE